MGLLDSILRRATNRVANAAADRVVDQVVDSIRGNGTSQKTNYNTGAQNTNSQPSTQPANNAVPEDAFGEGYCDAAECRKRILACLSQNFASYSVQENAASSIMGENGGMPYSIAVYQGGTVKLLIMIIGKTTCQLRKYRFSMEAAKRNGVTMINFVGHYPNRPDYICDRLRQYL